MRGKTLMRLCMIGMLTLLFALQGMATGTDVVVRQCLNEFETAKGGKRMQVANRLMDVFHQEELTEEHLVFAASVPDDSLCQQVWYWAGEFFYTSQDFHQAVFYAKKALPFSEGTDVEADCLNLLALSCFRLSEFKQAVEYAKRCYKIDEKSGGPDIMSSSLNTLAGIYIDANQPKEAEKYILKGIELSEKAKNPTRMAVLQGMASEVYHAIGDDTKALLYIDEACRIEKELNRPDKLMVRLAQKASVLIGMHRYQEAEAILESVIPTLRAKGNRHSLGIACNKMGMTLLSQERETEAIPYYREAAGIFVAMGDMHNEMHSRKGLYESLWNQCPDSAKLELERFNELKDSLYSNATAESLSRYNAEFGTDLLRLENEIQRERIYAIVLVGLIAIVLLAGGIWWFMNRRMKVRETALQTIIEGLKEDGLEEHTETEKAVSLTGESSSLTQTDRTFLTQLIAFVMKGMPQGNLSLEVLASEMCITRGQLNRKVKAVTGITTQQYVLRVRMEYARLLLQQSPQYSIFEVSCRCGFEDAASFSRAFRRTFGKSPTQYREELV